MLIVNEIDEAGNGVIYRSAFRSSSRRTRNSAHMRLVRYLRGQGYQRPGDEPLPEVAKIPDDLCWNDLERHMVQTLGNLSKLADFASTLIERDRGDHWINPETGQRIYDNELMLAASLWTLDEVCALVPKRQQEVGCDDIS